MTGEELKAIQRESGLSDRAFLEWLAIAATSTSRRRLRRWKIGEVPIPEDLARNVERTFREEVEAIACRSVDGHA